MKLRLCAIARDIYRMHRARRDMEKTMKITLQSADGPVEVDHDALVYLRYEAATARTLQPRETGRMWVGEKCVPVWKDEIDNDCGVTTTK
jgi:hypothetical protein